VEIGCRHPSRFVDPSGYYVASGTSMASPHVAGAAALHIARHPYASPAGVRGALVAMAEPGPLPEDPDSFPEGLLNVRPLLH